MIGHLLKNIISAKNGPININIVSDIVPFLPLHLYITDELKDASDCISHFKINLKGLRSYELTYKRITTTGITITRSKNRSKSSTSFTANALLVTYF